MTNTQFMQLLQRFVFEPNGNNLDVKSFEITFQLGDKASINIWLNEEGEGSVDYYDGNGSQHRDGGPAKTEFTMESDGIVRKQQEAYYQHGRYHREDGPAYIYHNYDESGKHRSRNYEYFYDNEEITRNALKMRRIEKQTCINLQSAGDVTIAI